MTKITKNFPKNISSLKINCPGKSSSKKGSSILLMIFEILVVVLVVGMSFSIANDYAKSQTAQKILFTKDLALMVDTLMAFPGNSQVQFPHNTTAFIFIINNGEAVGILKGEEDKEELKIREKIHLPQGFQASGLADAAQSICLLKQGKYIFLKDCKEIKDNENIKETEEIKK
ncbi:hypothetical protein HYU21_04080 [Candidatus Woesearchaeota archaeon]|nr:hypothetical protein [Candidatus Woesearchaeota archaeon]